MYRYEVIGWGRETNRRRKRFYDAKSEDDAIMKASVDGTIVESITVVADIAELPHKAMVSRVLKHLQPYGIEASDYEIHRKALYNKFGSDPNPGDVAWSLYVHAGKQQTDYGSLGRIAWLKARFLYEEGRDPTQQLRIAAKMQVAEYKQSGVVSRVKILGRPDCKTCELYKDECFAVDDAYDNPPIPFENCANKELEVDKYPWCSCELVAEL